MSLKNQIEEFGKILGATDSYLDKNHPRIAEMLVLHWGYVEIYQYINKLLIVDKERNRQGFAPEALREIYFLQELHNKLFPLLKIFSTDIHQNNFHESQRRSSSF